MLTCREVTALASSRLDGELSLRKRLAIRVHLMMCIHCRRFQRQFRLLVEAARRHGLDGAVVGSEFATRVMTSLDAARTEASTKPTSGH